MARFSGNPIKNPLTGNEDMAATDPASGLDVSVTPVILTQFAQKNMTVATGSTQGLVTGANGDKLAALPSAATIASRFAQVGEVSIPVFIPTPANGTILLYQHVCDVPWVLSFGYGVCSAGSTNVTVNIRNNPVAGFTSKGVTTVSSTLTGTDTPDNSTLNQLDGLSLTLAGTTGNCANLTLSLRANATIT